MRETVDATSVVCTVEKTRWPVSAAREGDAHRLGSRISPTTRTSGRLAHRGAQRGREIGRVRADLDLLDEARAVRMLVLDRVLDRDDVARVAPVDLLDEGGERRRLARARRAADQHEAARQPRQRLDARRQAERREPRRLRGEGAHGGGRAAPLPVQVDAETAAAGDLEGRVRDLLASVDSPRPGGERGQDRLFDLLARKRRLVQGEDGSVHPDAGRRAGHEKQIAPSPLDQDLEPAGQAGGFLGVGLPPLPRIELPNEAVDVFGFVHAGIVRKPSRSRRLSSRYIGFCAGQTRPSFLSGGSCRFAPARRREVPGAPGGRARSGRRRQPDARGQALLHRRLLEQLPDPRRQPEGRQDRVRPSDGDFFRHLALLEHEPGSRALCRPLSEGERRRALSRRRPRPSFGRSEGSRRAVLPRLHPDARVSRSKGGP